MQTANKEEVTSKVAQVVGVVQELVEKNLYKCERNVYSRALSVLRYLVSDLSKSLP
jgi:hypothetical protein